MPLKVYDPTGKGVVNPNANPPIGLFVNSANGDFICTPEADGSFLVSALIKEWKKDKNGKWQQIGQSFKCFIYNVATCPNNNAPIIYGPYSYIACVGDELCVDVTTFDQVKVPPPPLVSPKPDTVTISWDKGIAGASFKIVSDTARLQTGRFCWTPTVADANKYQHAFQVTARDNACPFNAVTIRRFNIYAKEKVQYHLRTKQLSCGRIEVEALRDSGYSTGTSIWWSALDSLGKPLTEKHLIPASRSGLVKNSYSKDTLTFRQNGTYIIRLEVFGLPNECTKVLFDTVEIVQSVPIYVPADTSICCPNATINLRKLEHPTSAGNQWKCLGNPNAILGDSVFKPNPLCSDTHRTFVISYSNKDNVSGCIVSDSFTIEVRGKVPSKLNDLNICTDSLFIDPMKEEMTKSFDWKGFKYDWSCLNCATINWGDVYNSKSYPPEFKLIKDFQNLADNDYRELKVRLKLTDSIGCSDVDSAFFRVLGEPKINRNLFSRGTPDYLCSSDSGLQLQKTSYPAEWFLNGKALETDHLRTDTMMSGTYSLKMHSGKNCGSDSIIFDLLDTVKYDYLPKDFTVISRKNHQENISIQEGYTTGIRWFIDSPATLASNIGFSNVVNLPHEENLKWNVKKVYVWVKNLDAKKCTTRFDTTTYLIRPNPCSEIIATPEYSLDHLQSIQLEAKNKFLDTYMWSLEDGKFNVENLSKVKFYVSSEIFWAELWSFSTFGDKCSTRINLDFSSIPQLYKPFHINPNPVINILKISNLNINNGDNYSIFDAVGRKIQTGILTEEIDCSRLVNGYYVLRLHTKNGELQMPFLKGD